MNVLKRVIPLVTTVFLVSACGLGGGEGQPGDDNSNRSGASTITFELPDGVSEVPDYEPTDGWTKSFTDNPSDPKVVIRVSDDLGRTAEADSTLGVIRGEAMFGGTHGGDFLAEKVSNRGAEQVAGVENIGTGVSPAMVEGIRNSLEYTP